MTGRAAILAVALGCCTVARADDGLAAWRSADQATQQAVLSLARRAFDAYAARRDVIEPPMRLPDLLKRRAGVFVSTMRNGAPRTCMGTIYPMEANVAREIVANAVASAGRDRRFPPVKPSELKGLILIVSIVDRPEPLGESDLRALRPEHDGLMAKLGDRCGVVLPGETSTVERMERWARVRAKAGPGEPVQWFRLDVVRFMEGRPSH